MKVSNIWIVAFCSGVGLTVLQGCGEDDASTTTTAAPDTTTTTTKEPTPPMSSEDAAAHFNEMYMDFEEGNDASSVGVVMRTTNKWEFFCEGFKAYTGCYLGQAACISSASILNNKVMLKDNTPVFGLDRGSGILFNTSMIETELGRCTYQYDGVSYGRYYRGCGSMAKNGEEKDCKDPASAFMDVNPATNKNCTMEDDLVLMDYCPVREKDGTMPVEPIDGPCFWKGPAFFASGEKTSETRKMLTQRIANQGKDKEKVATWNEVVIDVALLLEVLRSDPATAIPAMVYRKTKDAIQSKIAKEDATKMAKAMQAEFGMVVPVPVVGVDITIDVTEDKAVGPFIPATNDDLIV